VSRAIDGFGPELVLLDSGATRSIGVELRSRGTAGHVLGVAHVIRYEKNGAHLSIEPRPFVLMNEGSELSLGSVANAPDGALAQHAR
jgi:cysteine synthase